MDPIVVKSAGYQWDSLSLGEVMLRLDPGKAGSIPRDNSRSGKAAANTTWHVDYGDALVCARGSSRHWQTIRLVAWSKILFCRAESTVR